LFLKQNFDFSFIDKDPKWMRALEAFKSASAVYKKKNPCHQPPVIVYDNISRLIHIDPKILDFLQDDDAKDNADDRNYITVFVCSEGLSLSASTPAKSFCFFAFIASLSLLIDLSFSISTSKAFAVVFPLTRQNRAYIVFFVKFYWCKLA
jgi:hypothetical protein